MQSLARVSAHIVSDALEFMSGSRIRVDQLQITLYTFVFSIYPEAAVPEKHGPYVCERQTPGQRGENNGRKKIYTINELNTKYLHKIRPSQPPFCANIY